MSSQFLTSGLTLDTNWMTVTLVVGGAITAAIYILLKLSNVRDPLRKRPPCLPSLPFIGSLPFLPTKTHDMPKFLMEKYHQLGPIFAFYSGTKYTVVLNTRAAIVGALLKHPVDYADRQAFHSVLLTNPSRNGLGNRQYDKVFQNNHRLTQTILKEFGFGSKNLIEERILEELNHTISKIKNLGVGLTDPSRLIESAIGNIILTILFGKRYADDSPILSKLIELVKEFFDNVAVVLDVIPLLRFLPSFRQSLLQLKRTSETFIKLMDEETSTSMEAPYDSFVKSFAAREGENLDRNEMLYIARDLTLGGIDSAVATLGWALVMLAGHPHIQEKIQQEIDSVVPWDRLPSLTDKPNLTYTEASMLEVLRWRSIGPIILLRSTLCDTEVNGYFIPAKTVVMSNVYSAHMDPKVWPEPHLFKPERFLNEDGHVTGSERVVSFSFGKRSCIGEELARAEVFLFFAGLVQRFKVRPPEGQSSFDVPGEGDLVMRPSAHQIRFIPRGNDL